MSAKGITDEPVREVANDLRARYGLDDEDMRALGSRLADSASTRSAENIEFAKRFTEEHRETFDRLAKSASPRCRRAGSRPSRTTSTARHTCSAPSGQPSRRCHDYRSRSWPLPLG